MNTNNPIKNEISPKGCTNFSEAHEKMSMSLTIREIQVKTTVMHNLPPNTMLTFKRTKHKNVSKNIEQLEPLYSIGRNVN